MKGERIHIIGLTGGIGSGKSFIARGLRERGYAVYDTDREAKRLIAEDEELKRQLIELFGPDTYAPDGTYQTRYVARRVFEDKTLLERLNAIVHPAVRRDFEAWKDSLPSSFHRGFPEKSADFWGPLHLSPFTFLESAILYESGFDTLCDKVVAVVADEDIRLRRVIGRDKTDIDKVRARMRAQLSEQELRRRADLVVMNDGNKNIEELCQFITQHL